MRECSLTQFYINQCKTNVKEQNIIEKVLWNQRLPSKSDHMHNGDMIWTNVSSPIKHKRFNNKYLQDAKL